MTDNNKTLLGGVSFNEEPDFDDAIIFDDKDLYRANLLYQYPVFIPVDMGLGTPISVESPVFVTDNNYSNNSFNNISNVKYVYIPKKQPSESLDYINKTGNVKDFAYIPPKQDEIVMKPIKKEKNYEDILKHFYPDMPDKSQIQPLQRIPLLSEDDKPIVKYYDDYPTLSDRNYIAKPIDMKLNSTQNFANILIKNIENNEKIRKDNFENMNFQEMTVSDLIKILNDKNPNDIPIKELKKFIKSDKLYLFKNELYKNFGIEATENLLMAKNNSYLSTPYANQFIIYNSYIDLPLELKTIVRNKIITQIGEENLGRTKGIFIDSNSKTAENLSKNAELIEYINKNYSKIKESKYYNGSINFQNGNFALAIGKADCLFMKKLPNGNISVLILDIYDFNRKDERKLVIVGKQLQDEGILKPYFIIYHVIIQNKLLKQENHK